MSSMAYYEEVDMAFTESDMPPPPTHCRCGRLLQRDYEDDGYTKTGRLDRYPVWRCPLTRGWWNRLLLRQMWPHQEYEPDRFIEPYWRQRQYR